MTDRLDTPTGVAAASAAQPIDVVIMGAGPVGLTVANYLALQGVGWVGAQRNPPSLDMPRASGSTSRRVMTRPRFGRRSRLRFHVFEHAISTQTAFSNNGQTLFPYSRRRSPFVAAATFRQHRTYAAVLIATSARPVSLAAN